MIRKLDRGATKAWVVRKSVSAEFSDLVTRSGCQRVTATEMADQVERVPLKRVCARAATTTASRSSENLSLSLPPSSSPSLSDRPRGFARKSNESLLSPAPRV